MDKIILDTFTTKVGSRTRKMVTIQCPDCGEQRTARADGVDKNETTCCRSCLNLRRPTKPEEELFNHTQYYRSKEGRLASIYQTQRIRSKRKGWPEPSYTQQELIEWAISQDIYHSLFKAWEESNYKKDLSPSVDRIDDYGYYTMDNIQLMAWKDNNAKGTNYQKNGINLKNCKAVKQYSLKGDYIATFHSIIEAERQTGISNATISRSCRKEQCTAGGFKWRYA